MHLRPKEASILNRMVLLYAVPIVLFVGTVGTPRADLVHDIAFDVAIFVAIVGLYALVFLSAPASYIESPVIRKIRELLQLCSKSESGTPASRMRECAVRLHASVTSRICQP
jgi:predicted permease